MAQVIVRNLGDRVVGRLKRRARSHGRSLEAEVRDILGSAVNRSGLEWGPARKRLAALRKRLSGRRFPRMDRLIREERG